MDRGKLKTFAVEARKKLINDVKVRLGLVGIGEESIEERLEASQDDLYIFDLGNTTYKIEGKDISSYKSLKKEIEKRSQEQDYKEAYKSLVDEVAYSWFNRIMAIRFMEVNAYLPEKIRVLSSDTEKVREPDIVKYYDTMDLGLRLEEIEDLDRLRSSGKPRDLDELYRRLFIAQCNSLSSNLPELFEAENDYSELLLNISYLDEQGVVVRLREDLGEDYFNVEKTGQIEAIGWIYQYYNEEPRDKVINIYKGYVKKEHIPFATQLFTTKWVVQYMVENSLGKYWLERNPNSKLGDKLEYLIKEDLEIIDEEISPEDIRLIDNAMGSGHILIYSFDLLMEIYRERGYTEGDAARLIVEKNLYGLDIDKRAYQLAYFALLMKARKYDRRILKGQPIEHNLRVFVDSSDIDIENINSLGKDLSPEKRNLALEELGYLVEEFTNAREYGSILKLEKVDIDNMREFLSDFDHGQMTIESSETEKTRNKLIYILDIAEILQNKYDLVITNPPYLNKMSPKMKKYVSDNYSDYKKDLFSVFIYININLCREDGYAAYMTPFVWMFISSYEKLREYILDNKHIDSLIQMEYSAFEEATVPICSFVLKNSKNTDEKGSYIRLSDFKGGMEVQKIKTLEAIENPDCGYYYRTKEDNFKLIPGSPIAYWASDRMYEIFDTENLLGNISQPKQGLATTDNKRFLRKWVEVPFSKIGFEKESRFDFKKDNVKWAPYNKGGSFRKWYGNQEYVVNWYNDGFEIIDLVKNKYKNRSYAKGFTKERWDKLIKVWVVKNIDFYFKTSISWTFISSSKLGVRYYPKGFIFDVSGSSLFPEKYEMNYVLGLMCSEISEFALSLINPTLNFQVGNIGNIPFILSEEHKPEIDALVEENISISKIDWDSYETSWDFEKSPLLDEDKIEKTGSIEEAYRRYRDYANGNFRKLKANEERLNQIFIEIYGLEDELTPEVSDRDITITKVFDRKEDIEQEIKGNRYVRTCEDLVKDFVSYGIGCIFGRYSLDEEGLVFAGGDFKIDRYSRFKALEDNIALVTELDYMEGDLASKFFDFVEASFGSENLEENLDFIGNALSTKKSIGSREKIRNYLAMEFYEDHVKKYQKTPIYWLYDSDGARTKTKSKHGFKALIYMHRYNEDTSGRVRVDYLHKVQARYGNVIKNLEDRLLMEDDPRESKKIRDEIDMLKARLDDCKAYDEKMNILSNERISIDLDDGVKANYEKIQKDSKGKKHDILRKI